MQITSTHMKIKVDGWNDLDTKGRLSVLEAAVVIEGATKKFASDMERKKRKKRCSDCWLRKHG